MASLSDFTTGLRVAQPNGCQQLTAKGGSYSYPFRHTVRLTPAVSRANSRSEGRAKAVGVGSSAGLGVLDDVCEHPDELAQIVDVVFFEV